MLNQMQNQNQMQAMLNAIQDACQMHSNQVQIFANAMHSTESLDESKMQTMAITIKTRPNCKPIYDYDNPDDSPEIQCQELAYITAKTMLETYICNMLKDCSDTDIKISGTNGFSLIQGFGQNLLYNATLLLTDETLYITLTETGQF